MSKKITIELPVALPTWNRILAMNPWERKKLRDAIHTLVAVCISIPSEKHSVTQMELAGKLHSMESFCAAYYQMIRPGKLKVLRTVKRRASRKKR